MPRKIVSLDFELCGVLDLRDVGSYVWTQAPDTHPIILGFAFDHAPVHVLGFDLIDKSVVKPPGAEAAISYAGILERLIVAAAAEPEFEFHAWNAAFEFDVWNNLCVPRFGWPALPIERFHCTMATAACAGLPMSLDDAAPAVGAPFTKDAVGHRTMLRMARPRRIDIRGVPAWWHREDDGKLRELISYNIADVEAERAVHLRMPRMTMREREIWLVDQHMNRRGLPVDKAFLGDLMGITLAEILRLNNEIARITGGEITSVTQNSKLLAWAQAEGYPYTSLAKDTLDGFLAATANAANAVTPKCLEVLHLRAEAAKTSTAKLKSIENYTSPDGRARNLVQYGGAVRTLRWAGRGPQIQNFPKPIIKDEQRAVTEIKAGLDIDGIRTLFGRPLDVVSSCLRSVFRAPPGHTFVVADYHAIEAIVVGWLCDFQDLLDVFRRHEDVYVFTAKGIEIERQAIGQSLAPRVRLRHGLAQVSGHCAHLWALADRRRGARGGSPVPASQPADHDALA